MGRKRAGSAARKTPPVKWPRRNTRQASPARTQSSSSSVKLVEEETAEEELSEGHDIVTSIATHFAQLD